MAQTKAGMLTNRLPSNPMGSANFLSTALRADASGVPLELAAPSAEAVIAQAGRRALKDVAEESRREARGLTSEAKTEALRQKIPEIEAAGESRLKRAAAGGVVGFLQQLARAELVKAKEQEAENLADLKQAAKDGRDEFFGFLEAAKERGVEFSSEDINDAYRLIPGVERERRLARQAYKQEPVDFSRGEDYRRNLIQRSIAESPEVQSAAAGAALRAMMGLSDDTQRLGFDPKRDPFVASQVLRRPEFRQPSQPSFLAAQEGVLASQPALVNPFDQPELAAFNLARSEESILNPQGSRAVGAAAKGLKLREGASGVEVLEAQKALKALPGFEKASFTDGKYDQAFKNAVAAFQKSQGLSADGILGPNTYEALFRELYKRAEVEERMMLNLRNQRQQEANLAAQLFGGVK